MIKVNEYTRRKPRYFHLYYTKWQRAIQAVKKFFALLGISSVMLLSYYLVYGAGQITDKVEVKTEIQKVENIVVLIDETIPPILVKIAKCESLNKHLDKEGRVKLGTNPNDIGRYQINSTIWGRIAHEKGWNLYIEEDNKKMALYLFNEYGTVPWRNSAHCWNK